MKTIGIVGAPPKNARAIAEIEANTGIKVVIIEGQNPYPNPVIEIDGVEYQKKEEFNRNKNSSFGILGAMANMLAMSDSLLYSGSSYERKRPNVDILTEYQLILSKKSNLCRNDREWVEVQFFRMYEVV